MLLHQHNIFVPKVVVFTLLNMKYHMFYKKRAKVWDRGREFVVFPIAKCGRKIEDRG